MDEASVIERIVEMALASGLNVVIPLGVAVLFWRDARESRKAYRDLVTKLLKDVPHEE